MKQFISPFFIRFITSTAFNSISKINIYNFSAPLVFCMKYQLFNQIENAMMHGGDGQ